jgi:hypothetical protein
MQSSDTPFARLKSTSLTLPSPDPRQPQQASARATILSNPVGEHLLTVYSLGIRCFLTLLYGAQSDLMYAHRMVTELNQYLRQKQMLI